MITARTKSVDDTRALAAELATLARPRDLILLQGGLGTGKTAFAQGFARGLGIDEQVTSPTFVLVRFYEGRLRLVHIDVYRLDHMQELVDLGVAELLDEEAVTLIEWGDVVRPGLPADFLEVRLEPGDTEDERVITVSASGPSWPPRMRAAAEALSRWVPIP
jgi:tRNA threonylcarbamoyladenosine biosynthesis protein TsaE